MAVTASSHVRPHAGREQRGHARRQAACRPEPGRATLDDRISALWTRLVETGAGECPVCAADIAAGAPCGRCGSELT
jgi:hypothetical protein